MMMDNKVDVGGKGEGGGGERGKGERGEGGGGGPQSSA